MKTYIIGFFFMVFVSLLAVFLLLEKEKLPVGSKLPAINYTNARGPASIKNTNMPLIIVYFRMSCEHCRYQLTVFNNLADHIKGIDIYFLTPESDFFKMSYGIKLENLTHAKNITFGIIEKESFGQHFATQATPSLYFFNNHGTLVKKLHGETKAEKIYLLCNSLTSGRTQSRQ